ncbi:MAG TPA: lysylphosphatidylglycerol synthase transmembrane domain-containing protein [Terriglobales bacterium]|nr:lysylphosphatidylglycerol synthase transmembrane domain-containing protein [Terriglobales bacterium]
MNNRALKIGLSIAISVVFLYIAARDVDWPLAYAALASAEYWWAIPITAVTVLQIYLRAVRWRVLLRPLGKPAMRSIVAANNIGFLANFVLPLRAGEVIRPVLLSRREGLPLGGVLATNLIERIFDMFTILLLFGLTAALLPISESVQEWGGRLVFVALAIGGGVAFIRWQQALALSLLKRITVHLPAQIGGGLEHFFEGFVQALRVLDGPRSFFEITAWSLVVWLVVSFIFGMGIWMFDLPAPFPLGQICVAALVAIAVSAPSAPGFIGAFQLGCQLSLGLFGVEESRAFAYGIAIHVTQFVAVIGAGLYSLAREGLSLRQV